jgi:hypothetical protein
MRAISPGETVYQGNHFDSTKSTIIQAIIRYTALLIQVSISIGDEEGIKEDVVETDDDGCTDIFVHDTHFFAVNNCFRSRRRRLTSG